MHPTVVGTVERFLDHVTTVQLHLTQIISIDPGETQQKLHRDQMAFDFFPFPADYHVQCNTMWALTDFTAENGGTHVVPGSSSVPDAAAASLPGGQVEMRRGSVLFYDGKVLHGGGANRSDATTPGRQHHVRRRLGATGGEPVPRLPARDRAHPRRRPSQDDRIPAKGRSRSDTSATNRIRSRPYAGSTSRSRRSVRSLRSPPTTGSSSRS